jgi:hypothetical protein
MSDKIAVPTAWAVHVEADSPIRLPTIPVAAYAELLSARRE